MNLDLKAAQTYERSLYSFLLMMLLRLSENRNLSASSKRLVDSPSSRSILIQALGTQANPSKKE
jgi:hypothetical protein